MSETEYPDTSLGSVRLIKNAKGERQWEIRVTVDREQVRTFQEAVALARGLDQELEMTYGGNGGAK